MMRILVLALAVLTGCQGAALRDTQLPSGTTVELHRALTIPADRVSVFFQEGELRPHGGVDQYRPNCKFEIRTMAAIPREVRPDRFEVRRVQREVEGLLAGPLFTGIGIFGGDGPSPAPYITHLYLHSPEQPDVLRLSCRHWQDPAMGDSRHVTLAEIRHALGEFFSLRLPPLPPAGTY